MTNTSPGWVKPVNPTRNDRARIEGTIFSLEESARCYESAGHHNSAVVAQAHATVWRERLASLN